MDWNDLRAANILCILFFFAAHDAKMGLTETRLAIIPGGGCLLVILLSARPGPFE